MKGKFSDGVYLKLEARDTKIRHVFPRKKALNKFKERLPRASMIGPYDIFQDEIETSRTLFHITYLTDKAGMYKC